MVWKALNQTPSVSKKVSDEGGYRAARAAKKGCSSKNIHALVANCGKSRIVETLIEETEETEERLRVETVEQENS